MPTSQLQPGPRQEYSHHTAPTPQLKPGPRQEYSHHTAPMPLLEPGLRQEYSHHIALHTSPKPLANVCICSKHMKNVCFLESHVRSVEFAIFAWACAGYTLKTKEIRCHRTNAHESRSSKTWNYVIHVRSPGPLRWLKHYVFERF